ncbi:hypothetical protein [Clostridium intestinale]|uniref:Uncharacterized protein n=1 Tax=Clostridium intestinale URNW TaxID=1294142 RepID=U2Q2N6_9CLOT|nr:hypothetical protein [Clostridium intestinale]ERK30339.1 hypothetical protein CINTURNW_1707 [Clostridium intestinale URNW]
MLKLTGVAIITTAEGKRLTYSYSDVGDDGTIKASNIKRSFIAVDEELKSIIEQLESKVSNHMNINE